MCSASNLIYYRIKCCTHESEIGIFNQTLLPLKNQCQKDVRKSLNDDFSSAWGGIENEDAVLNLDFCDQKIGMKSIMFCTLDCIAQKLGMVQ
jgi:hypothetical protein